MWLGHLMASSGFLPLGPIQAQILEAPLSHPKPLIKAQFLTPLSQIYFMLQKTTANLLFHIRCAQIISQGPPLIPYHLIRSLSMELLLIALWFLIALNIPH